MVKIFHIISDKADQAFAHVVTTRLLNGISPERVL